jgi:dTDP-4-dehydrorhamnose 3,5-epimerase
MKITPLALPEVLLIEPRVFGDHRGFFFESWSAQRFAELDVAPAFVQDNISFSSRGTLRGLHLQHPHAQGKLVMALTGKVFDVAVDVRVGSPTFGKAVGQELSDENHYQMYVPPGFAHGFCVLSETAHFAYKCTDGYHPETELSVRFDDPDLGIPWPNLAFKLSAKDEAALRLRDIPEARLPAYRGSPRD